MDATCGPARYRIARTADAGTTLVLLGVDGERVLAAPAGLSDFAPVGMACAAGTGGTPYLVVQYGDPTNACAGCEWFVLYDTEGQAVTRHEPAFVEDVNPPATRRRSANNAAYEAALQRLGIEHPEVDTID